MTTIRTTLNLRKHEARRLTNGGYEILHIKTHHHDTARKAGSSGRGPLDPTTFRRENSRTDRHEAGSEQGPALATVRRGGCIYHRASRRPTIRAQDRTDHQQRGSAFERKHGRHATLGTERGAASCSLLLLAANRKAPDSDACFLYYGDTSGT